MAAAAEYTGCAALPAAPGRCKEGSGQASWQAGGSRRVQWGAPRAVRRGRRVAARDGPGAWGALPPRPLLLCAAPITIGRAIGSTEALCSLHSDGTDLPAARRRHSRPTSAPYQPQMGCGRWSGGSKRLPAPHGKCQPRALTAASKASRPCPPASMHARMPRRRNHPRTRGARAGRRGPPTKRKPHGVERRPLALNKLGLCDDGRGAV